MLTAVGALNPLEQMHRRGALWEVERAARPAGPLLPGGEAADSPLAPMNDRERLTADFRGAGLTVGRHPMAYRRAELDILHACRARDLARIPHGRMVRVGGCVVVRQRPGTAKGFVFLSLEDETGIANIIVEPDVFERHRQALTSEPFLLIDGVLQNQDRVVSVKLRDVRPLAAGAAAASHDFH